MLKLLRSFRRNQTGNIAMITAMLAVPLMGVAGGAVDFGRLQMVRSRLQDSVDAASVGAVGKNSEAMNAAATMTDDGSISVGSTEATRLFNADMSVMKDVTVSGPTTGVTKTGMTVTASVTAQAAMPTVFLRIMGISSLNTSATASSSNSLPAFIDFYLLLDNSPSMGVGATPADVSTMVAATPTAVYGSEGQCAFACHVTTPGATDNFYALAKTLGVTMRIDVLRQATQQLMDTATSTETVPNQFRMGVYTFGASADSLGFTTVAAPTTNLATAKSQAGAVDLMTVPYQNYNDDTQTDFAKALSGANGAIATPGTGASSASPQKVLFLVSDGVNDSYINGVRTIQTVDPSYCTTMKNRGIQIAVLYTTYLPLPTNAFYVQNVQPFSNTINPTMQSCASPGLFFEVSPTQGISQAMTALFQKVVANAHITQ